MKTIDFKEEKAKREGQITPKELLKNALAAAEQGMIESIVFVARQTDGEIKTGWSKENFTHILGLLECGKAGILQEMWEPE